jgi:predicted PurR-regulated permease PerM
VATRALGVGQDALWVTVLFALMLYLLFFFFRDGHRIVARMVRSSLWARSAGSGCC